jgi:hypothetical protein
MRCWLPAIHCLAIALSLTGCAAHLAPPASVADAAALSVVSCRSLYSDVDAWVKGAAVGDAQSARISDYPYLRIDRFLAADEVKPDAGSEDFDAWVARLRDLDLQARKFELQALPDNLNGKRGESLAARLDACAEILIISDLKSPAAREELLEISRVGDDYSITKRVIGLYPFTSLPFKAGVRNLHEGIEAEFSRPLESLSVKGRLTRYRPAPEYAPMSVEAVRVLLEDAGRKPQGIPDLSVVDRQRLFETFAPVYEIDIVSDDDRIGMPVWTDDGTPSVDVGRPVVFRRISYTRFEGRTLLQLNYSVWFPSRPSDGDFDLLSGRLDAITFRVTLDRDGRPLLYDSMHNCGCYHLFVPTRRLQPKPPPDGHEEPPLIPQRIGQGVGGVVLRIAHRTHYLQRVYFDASVDTGDVYAMHDDDSLRSLPTTEGGRRSLFQPSGLVHGTERGERWFFWPMGIAEPGAMRQWGHHATLFVGKRHFDEPHLIERYFRSGGGG